jgi:hypothetical protein
VPQADGLLAWCRPPGGGLNFGGGLYGSFELAEDLAIEPLVELVHFENADGSDHSLDIVTVGAGFVHGPRNLALAYAGAFRDPDDSSVEDLDVRLYQVSAGYSFDFGFSVDLGYKFVDEEGVGSHTVGVLFHDCIDLVVPGRVSPGPASSRAPRPFRQARSRSTDSRTPDSSMRWPERW